MSVVAFCSWMPVRSCEFVCVWVSSASVCLFDLKSFLQQGKAKRDSNDSKQTNNTNFTIMNILSLSAARFRHSTHNVCAWNLLAVWWVSPTSVNVSWGWPNWWVGRVQALTSSRGSRRGSPRQCPPHDVQPRLQITPTTETELEVRVREKRKVNFPPGLCEECFSCWADRREDTSKRFSYFVFGWKNSNKEEIHRSIVFAVIGETLIVSKAIRPSAGILSRELLLVFFKRGFFSLFGRGQWTGLGKSPASHQSLKCRSETTHLTFIFNFFPINV